MAQSAVITATPTTQATDIPHAAFCTDHSAGDPYDHECRGAEAAFGDRERGAGQQPFAVLPVRVADRPVSADTWRHRAARVLVRVDQGGGEWWAETELSPEQARAAALALLAAADTAEGTR